MEGSLKVDPAELLRLGVGMDRTAAELTGDLPRLDAAQTGNSGVASALETFATNWDYHRREVVAWVGALAKMLSTAGMAYLETEAAVKQAASSAPSVSAPVAGGPTPAQPISTAPLAGHGRTRDEVLADFDRNWRRWEDDLWPDGGPDGKPVWGRYQCTAWMWYRMRELGYDGERIPQRGLDNRVYVEQLGGSRNTVPEPGAVVAREGHVMIAEEVYIDADGHRAMRVSEMNTDSDHEHGLRSEYRQDQIWVERDDGQWVNQMHPSQVWDFSIWKPPYGTARI